MKERSFVHLDSAGGGSLDTLPKTILTGEAAITHREISRYVDALVLALKKQTDKKQVQTFLVEHLSDNALIKRYFQRKMSFWLKAFALVNKEARAELEHPEELHRDREGHVEVMKSEIQRIRHAIKEELKKRLTLDSDLQHIHYSDIQFDVSAPFEPLNTDYLKRQSDLNGKESVFKKEKQIGGQGESLKDQTSQEEKYEHARALRILAALPEHENILSPDQFDPEKSETIATLIDLKDKGNIVLFRREEQGSLREDLSIIRDCVVGAKFLADHGLVLQDISWANIGYYQKEDRCIGVLFDLEGLYPLGVPLKGRLHHKDIFLPELNETAPTPVLASEMVYEFGASFLRIVTGWMHSDTVPHNVKEKMHALYWDMMAYDRSLKHPADARIDLETALERLNQLIREVSDELGMQRALQEEREAV